MIVSETHQHQQQQQHKNGEERKIKTFYTLTRRYSGNVDKEREKDEKKKERFWPGKLSEIKSCAPFVLIYFSWLYKAKNLDEMMKKSTHTQQQQCSKELTV